MRAGGKALGILRVLELYSQWVAGRYLSVKVRVLGAKNAASTGQRVDVDSFVVLR
jgi:hypothetical protein